MHRSLLLPKRQKQLQRQQLHLWSSPFKPLMMISTGALTNVMLLLTPKKKKKSIDKVYDNTFVQINDGEMIKGTVVGLTKTDVVLNIGFKSDGLDFTQ